MKKQKVNERYLFTSDDDYNYYESSTECELWFFKTKDILTEEKIIIKDIYDDENLIEYYC